MSLRSRVALATAMASLLIVVATGALLLAAFRNGAEKRLDTQLSDQWRDLSQISLNVVRANRPAAEELLELGLQAPLAVRVVDDGEVLLSIGAPTVDRFEEAAPAGFSTVAIDGDRWRVLADTVAVRTRPTRLVEVQFASPLAVVDASVEDLRSRIVRAGLFVVVASGLMGWAIGAGALRPIGRLRSRAAEVAVTTDLGLRIDTDLGAAEVNELASDLNTMLERLEEGDRSRLDALDAARSFSAAAAHELRTPLTSMQANIDVLRRYEELEPADRDALIDELASQQQRLRGLLEALRMLARGDLAGANVFENVDLADVVGVAVGEVARREPDVDFTTDFRAVPAAIRAWPEGIRVMVDNLLLNAITHGRPVAGDARVHVAVRSVNGGVEISVGDNGPGVPEAERSSVLERFQRGASASGSGSGLGLALAAQQAELHGGTVDIRESRLGGAEVRVVLQGKRTSTR
jgi:two-component system sensor histidine kinase PrrB